MIQDLPFMTELLVKLMKNDPRVDIKNQWKARSIRQIELYLVY